MITNIHRNNVGTISFDARFTGMRKDQDFIVYPVAAGQSAERLMIQSKTRIGFVHLKDGSVEITPALKSGAYGVHLALRQPVGKLSGEELLLLKTHVAGSAGDDGKRRVVTAINDGAIGVLAV